MVHSFTNSTHRPESPMRLCTRLVLVLALNCGAFNAALSGSPQADLLRVTAKFDAQHPVAPNTTLVFTLSRSPLTSEGRLAVMVGDMDVSALCIAGDRLMTYV